MLNIVKLYQVFNVCRVYQLFDMGDDVKGKEEQDDYGNLTGEKHEVEEENYLLFFIISHI
jgi:hypothetical protein